MARDEDDFDAAVSCEGQEEAKTRLRDWLKVIAKSIEIEGDVPLELWNVGHGAEDAIYTTEWDITEPVDDIIEEIMNEAENDAMSVGRGQVRFKVIVEGRKKMGRAAFTLRIPNNNDIDTDDIEDIEELATRKGLMTQLMRHQEKTMKVGLGATDKVLTHLNRLLEAAHARIRELEGGFLNNAKTYEELLSGKHARDLELRKLDNDERRKEQVVGVLLQGMPILINKMLMGKSPATTAPPPGAVPEPGKPFDEAVSPLEQMIESFLQTFTATQLQDIMAKNVFTPEQLMLFMEIAKTIQARQEARAAKQTAA